MSLILPSFFPRTLPDKLSSFYFQLTYSQRVKSPMSLLPTFGEPPSLVTPSLAAPAIGPDVLAATASYSYTAQIDGTQ